MNTKGTERTNEHGANEIKVETVDVQSPPGENKESRMENVGVVHLTHGRRNSGNKGGVLPGAVDAVGKAFEAAKDAISGTGPGSNK